MRGRNHSSPSFFSPFFVLCSSFFPFLFISRFHEWGSFEEGTGGVGDFVSARHIRIEIARRKVEAVFLRFIVVDSCKDSVRTNHSIVVARSQIGSTLPVPPKAIVNWTATSMVCYPKFLRPLNAGEQGMRFGVECALLSYYSSSSLLLSRIRPEGLLGK